MITRDYLSAHDPLPDPTFVRTARTAWTAMCAATGTRIVWESQPPPHTPCILACNASHRYDFLPFRAALLDQGIRVSGVSKPKNFRVAWERFAQERAGVIPMASRGYLIAWDFFCTLGRRPTAGEYATLRAAVDAQRSLPDSSPFDVLAEVERDVCGYGIYPAVDGYAASIEHVFGRMFKQSVELAARVLEGGCHVQIYPEGTVSARLGAGHPGTAIVARTLGVPVVPVGLSHAPSCFRGDSPFVRGGGMKIRAGTAVECAQDGDAAEQTRAIMAGLARCLDLSQLPAPCDDPPKPAQRTVARFM